MKNGDFPIANGHLFEWENPCPPCQSPSLQGLGRDVDLWNASTGPARHAGHGTASGERRKKRWKISKITMLFMGKSPFFMGNQLCIAMLFMENYGKLWKCINYGKTMENCMENTMENHHAIHGKTHYFDWAMFNSKLYSYVTLCNKLPEGIITIIIIISNSCPWCILTIGKC